MDVILDDNQKLLPNATATLVLGIISIVLSCSGIGLILGIVGLVMSKEGNRLSKENPLAYSNYGSLNAGRIMCILGIIFNGLVFVYLIIYALIMGLIFSSVGFGNFF